MTRHLATWRIACIACIAMAASTPLPVRSQGVPSGAGRAAGAAAPTAVAARSDSVLDARTADVAAHLRCPVCQGLSIQDSPSELAQQMRSLVREQLAAGKSPSDVRAYFVARYGEWILLEPRPSGFNIMVYAVPVAAVLAGLVLIAVAVRRWTRQPATPS